MKTFFKMLIASILGGAILIFLIFFTLIGIGMAGQKEFELKENSVLFLDLNYPINERESSNPFQNFDPISGQAQKTLGLYEIVKAIKEAKENDKVAGIYIKSGNVEAGMGTLKEIRDALVKFKESGKFIIAFDENLSQRGYYLSSVADSIYVPEEGIVEFGGLSTAVPFYRKFLENVGIKAEVVRGSNNKFKSAVEPFLEYQISEANREQITTFQNSIWSIIRADIATSRNIAPEKLDEIANTREATIPQRAAELGLITRTAYLDEVRDVLVSLTKNEKYEDVQLASVSQVTSLKKSSKDKTKSSRDRIAIVFAQGEIGSGEGSDTEIGSDRIAEAIRKAHEDEKVKAIVMRVNSPGGAVLASDIILREVIRAKEKKPFIVSFGDLAASGGYYISCMADTIVAQPTTITGSIGVFGLFFSAQDLLNNKLGIRFDVVKTHEYADFGAIDRPLRESERQFLQRYIDKFYGGFLKKVASGRGLDSLYIDSIGQGRVWTGEWGLKLGLVDVLGGLQDAIDIAAKKAGLDAYKIVTYPEPVDPFKVILKQLGFDSELKLKKQLGILYFYFEKIKSIYKQQGLLMRMEYDFHIQ
ncbi:MAG: signal peptide peptidase SppA [Thermaurantimonas sp.]|uniref:signal peptide peptidase SppA n=1 Tax=Thermaurantimonas sp. TaxID=2681568 RepID=UPI00391C3BD8